MLDEPVNPNPKPAWLSSEALLDIACKCQVASLKVPGGMLGTAIGAIMACILLEELGASKIEIAYVLIEAGRKHYASLSKEDQKRLDSDCIATYGKTFLQKHDEMYEQHIGKMAS